MKKKGFTIAELLITLTIIGVVSALVLPQFVANMHNQTNASKLSAIASDYGNILGSMLIRENTNNIFSTRFGVAYLGGNAAAMRTALEEYTKVGLSGTTGPALGYLSYNFVNPLIPAAWAGDACCDDPESECYDEYTCTNLNYCLEHGGQYTPGEEGQIGTCNSVPCTNPDGCTQCSDQADPHTCYDDTCDHYSSSDCVKMRCVNDPANGTYNETTGTCDPRNATEPPVIPAGSGTAMYTINNRPVSNTLFNFVFAAGAPNGAVVFFRAPEQRTENNKTIRFSTIFIDVNGSSVPNKFGRDVFAFVLDDEGNLYPYGSEDAARTVGLGNPAHNTWQGNSQLYGCTGALFNNLSPNGLGCTARLFDNNFKVDY